MFRQMRREKQLLSMEETIAILNSNTSGVLGLIGDEGYPYTVPISYTYREDKLYFHCAKAGHKIDSIKQNEKVSFCVIDQDDVSQEDFSTSFRSVIVFGRARILTEDAQRLQALQDVVKKYSPDYIEEGEKVIQRQWDNVCVIELNIEYMTGKTHNN